MRTMIGLLKKAIVRLANQDCGKFVTYFQLFFEPAGVQNKYLGAASQMLLARLRLHLRRRLLKVLIK